MADPRITAQKLQRLFLDTTLSPGQTLKIVIEAVDCLLEAADRLDAMDALDKRPANCRFRLRDTGQPYPRSGCKACGWDITKTVPHSCQPKPQPVVDDKAVKDREGTIIAMRRILVPIALMAKPSEYDAEEKELLKDGGLESLAESGIDAVREALKV